MGDGRGKPIQQYRPTNHRPQGWALTKKVHRPQGWAPAKNAGGHAILKRPDQEASFGDCPMKAADACFSMNLAAKKSTSDCSASDSVRVLFQHSTLL